MLNYFLAWMPLLLTITKSLVIYDLQLHKFNTLALMKIFDAKNVTTKCVYLADILRNQ